MRCLVVDDNRALAENLAEILRDGGVEASVAAGGAEALELIGRSRFDLLVTDMRMPGMSGAALIRKARTLDPGLPALLITAYTDEGDLAEARREGLLAILPKPVPIAQLEVLARAARRDGLVAVVEDDAAMADNIADALHTRGFSTVVAGAAEQLAQLGSLKLCAAVVDLKLPDAPKGEVVARVGSQFPDVPILVFSGLIELLPADVKPAAAFSKPLELERLIVELERLHAHAVSRA